MNRLAILLLLTCPCLLAQDCAVSIPATILDEKTGMFVQGIAPEMLHAKIGKVLVPVQAVERIQGLRVIVLFDQSGSMAESDSIFSHTKVAERRIQETLLQKIFLQLPQDTQVLIGAFDQEAAFGGAFSRDPRQLQAMLDEVTARLKKRGYRRTAMFDAIRQGLERFGTAQRGDSLVVITDGVDNQSKVPGKELASELASRQVRVFTVLFGGTQPSIPPEFTESVEWVRRFSELTGGSVYNINAGNTLWTNDKWSEKAREDLGRFWNEEVLSAYMLRFQRPPGTKKNQKWLLAVNPAVNANRRVVAAFPAELGLCPATVAAR